MAIIAGELIRQAYKLASVLSQSEEPQGFYASDGIIMLNEILSQWGSMGVYIPYDSRLVVPLQANISSYEVYPVVAQLLEGNIFSSTSPPGDSLLSVLQIATPKEANMFQDYRSGRPSFVYLSREKVVSDDGLGTLGSRLDIFPTPTESTLNMSILLKYNLSIVDVTQQLDNIPPYYLKPLKYQLAKDFGDMYKNKLGESFYAEYERLMTDLKSTNPTDLTIQNTNPFRSRRPFRPDYFNAY